MAHDISMLVSMVFPYLTLPVRRTMYTDRAFQLVKESHQHTPNMELALAFQYISHVL